MFAATACEGGKGATEPETRTNRSAGPAGPVRDIRLAAEPGEIEVGPGTVYQSWFYNGQFPGPEIRVREGERLRIHVDNRLPGVGTTVHWHGIPVPNAMDGVPGLTQAPIPAGGEMVYDYPATPAGSYMYHSHLGLQLDRGLVGPLIIEERAPHIDYDREHVLVFDDFLPGAPRPLDELAAGSGRSRGAMMGRRSENGMMGRRGRGGMMGGMAGIVPPYAGLLINGRLPTDPAEFALRRGERLRLRLINPSSATTYRIALAGHRLTVCHTDGRPVEPVTVDSLILGMGERYDVIVDAENPGVWPLVAAPLEGDAPSARALFRYADAAASSAPDDGLPEGLRGGRRLRYTDLQSIETLPDNRPADRRFDLRLSGGMMMRPDLWAIDGEIWPDAPPLEIREGERVRVAMSNMSMMLHPMHLHGHFFRVGNALKDTVIVEPHMGRVSFDFVADNPGRWLFHCHNLYHMEAGMAREFRYV